MSSKTTIRNIDEDVLWDAKIYAAETKQRLGDVITEAVQLLIYEHETKEMGNNPQQAGEEAKRRNTNQLELRP